MKFYFAGAENRKFYRQLYHLSVRRILVSFFYMKSHTMSKNLFTDGICPSQHMDIMLDSGAFSAWARNTTINIDEYLKYITMFKITKHISLDVIGEAEESWNNYKYMKRSVLPIPVFHTKENFKWLERYCEDNDYIALGGMAGGTNSKKDMIEYLDTCFTIIRKFWPKKIHLFSLASTNSLVRDYPLYSSDSTGWLTGGKYGRVLRQTRLKQQLSKNIYDNQLPYMDKNAIAIKDGLRMEQLTTDIWTKRGIIWND